MPEKKGGGLNRERHPSVPADALTQDAVRISLGIRSIYTLDKLTAQCVAAGAPGVITPEGRSAKYGKWYPAELVAALRERSSESLGEAPPPGWYNQSDLVEMLGTGFEQVRDLVDRLKASGASVEAIRPFRAANGSVVDYFLLTAIESIAPGAVGQRHVRRVLQNRAETVELPSPLNPAELPPVERAQLASENPKLIKIIAEARIDIPRFRRLLSIISNRQDQHKAERELGICERLIDEYQRDLQNRSAKEMGSKLDGLQRVLRKIESTLRRYGAFGGI